VLLGAAVPVLVCLMARHVLLTHRPIRQISTAIVAAAGDSSRCFGLERCQWIRVCP